MRRHVAVVAVVLLGLLIPVVDSSSSSADPAPSHYATAPVAHFAMLDRDLPLTSHYDKAPTNGLLLVGNNLIDDGRALFSFTLPSIPGAVLGGATLDVYETRAATCTARRTDVYTVAGFTQASNWLHQPKVTGPVGQIATSAGHNSSCPASYVGVDITSALRQAKAAGLTTLSFELRAHNELDPTSSKLFLATSASLEVEYDTPPATPANLAADSPNAPCATGSTRPLVVASPGQQFVLGADAFDPDYDNVSTTFDVYSADHQTLIATYATPPLYNGRARAYLDGGTFSDQTTYAWRAQSSDGTLSSAWSPWCEFKVDNTVPDVPTQSTTDFGTTSAVGYVGQAGQVAISGGGSSTTAYQWAFVNSFPVDLVCGQSYPNIGAGSACTTAGAPVTVSVTPTQQFFQLCVRAVANNGRVSDSSCATYVVNPRPIPTPTHRWTTDGADTTATSVADTGSGTPTPLNFQGVSWINDGRSAPDSLDSVVPALNFTGAPAMASTTSHVLDVTHDFTVTMFADFVANDHAQSVLNDGQLSVTLDSTGRLNVCLDGSCWMSYNPVTTNDWGIFAVRWTASTSQLDVYDIGYVGTVTVTGTPSGNAPLTLGGTSTPFTAEIQNPTIYDQALPDDVIQRLAQS